MGHRVVRCTRRAEARTELLEPGLAPHVTRGPHVAGSPWGREGTKNSVMERGTGRRHGESDSSDFCGSFSRVSSVFVRGEAQTASSHVGKAGTTRAHGERRQSEDRPSSGRAENLQGVQICHLSRVLRAKPHHEVWPPVQRSIVSETEANLTQVKKSDQKHRIAFTVLSSSPKQWECVLPKQWVLSSGVGLFWSGFQISP